MSLGAIVLVSKDIQESIKFYKIFGLNFIKHGEEHYEHLEESGLRIMLNSERIMKRLNENWMPSKNTGIMLSFSLETIEDVDKTYQEILKFGQEGVTAPHDAFWGERFASVLDPDGNQVDFYCKI